MSIGCVWDHTVTDGVDKELWVEGLIIGCGRVHAAAGFVVASVFVIIVVM